MEDKTTNVSPPFTVSINPEILDGCRAQAVKNFEEMNQRLGGAPISLDKAYPFGGTVSVVGALFYVELNTVTPMEFTNGVKLTYHGKGGGIAGGAGVFAGAGLFSVDPATLNNVEVVFQLGGTPGVGHLGVDWILNWVSIGTGVFVGLSAFLGSGFGAGPFKRV